MKTLNQYRNINTGALTSSHVGHLATILKFFEDQGRSVSNIALTGESGEYAVRYFRHGDNGLKALEDALVEPIGSRVEIKTVVVIHEWTDEEAA